MSPASVNTITAQDNCWQIAGALWIDNASALYQQSIQLSMPKELLVDFSGVTDADTAALSLMMEWQRRATAEGCQIVFTALPANLSSLAALYGVSNFIPSANN